jgi:hypothetical protein
VADRAGSHGVQAFPSHGYASPIDVYFYRNEVTDEEITARLGRYCARHTQFGATQTAWPTPIPPDEGQMTLRDGTKRLGRRLHLGCKAT